MKAPKKRPAPAPSARPDLRIGISGWTYPPWRGTFFPEGLVQKEELSYASRRVNSIEINGTFYSLQRPSSFAAWHAATPDDFVFAVKAPRFITHIKRLRDVAAPLANFFASGILRLNAKLGPILWQLPPSFSYNRETLDVFFRLLPRTTGAALETAKTHDEHVRLGTWLEIDRDRPLRHALEVRHDSFATPEFIALLRAHDVAAVVADTAGKWPVLEDMTSDFTYIRLHGDEKLYVSGYTDAALRRWAKKIGEWMRGRSPASAKRIAPLFQSPPQPRHVFVYFDNDVKIRSPYDAMKLAHMLGVGESGGEGPPIESVAEEARSNWPPIARTLGRGGARGRG